MTEQEVALAIAAKIESLIDEYVFAPVSLGLTEEDVVVIKLVAQRQALDDLRGLAERDPASRGALKYVLESYASYMSVLYYRVAHQLIEAMEGDESHAMEWEDGNELEDDEVGDAYGYDNDLALLTVARAISERAKVETGVEIHPSAQIGNRFVIDHGSGTVIGETSIIGDRCYFLQFVVLGAKHIADGKWLRRHPKIGDGVQIAGGVRIYGPVTVGDNVIIEGTAVISHDIPDQARVRVVSTLQISICDNPPDIFGVIPREGGTIALVGQGLNGAYPVLVRMQHDAPFDVMKDALALQEVSDNELNFRVSQNLDPDTIRTLALGIVLKGNTVPTVFVTNAYALRRGN